MDKILTVGVVGLRMGESHARAVLDYGARLGAVCDTDEKRLQEASERLQVAPENRFTDYRALVENPDLDAVIIVTPDQLHRQMVLEFLAAGKHVMCEKPLALTRDDLCAIVEAAEQSDKLCMVGQICRFTPAFAKAKALVDEGVIGELYYVESEYAHDYVNILVGENNWRLDPLRHGVVGGGCHAVDLLRWYAGDPIEVFSYGTHKLLPQVPYDDATISILKFPNNVIGKIFVSTGCKRNYTMRTLLYGTKGTIICDNRSDTMQLFTMGENNLAEEPQIIPLDIAHHNTTKEFQVFADALLKGTPVEMTAREGAKTVAVALSMVEASQTGVPTKPNYEF